MNYSIPLLAQKQLIAITSVAILIFAILRRPSAKAFAITFFKPNETGHWISEQNVRKLINDSLSSAQKLPDLRNQIRSQLYKENSVKSEPSSLNTKLEKQLPQQNIRFNSKQIKQFNSNTLHFTPNMIAGVNLWSERWRRYIFIIFLF